MQIKLGNSFMFFLPNGSLHLTEEDPGPLEVDFQSLSSEEQNITRIAITTGQIINLSGEIEPVKENNKKEEANQEIIKDLYERDNILAGKLQIVLKQSLSNIKVEIGKINDSRTLNFILQMEQAGKARKSIIQLVNQKIENIQKEVLASITEINTNAKTDQLDPLSRSFVSEITDVIEEEVEVQLEE